MEQEISAREASFNQLRDNANRMLKENHFASDQIRHTQIDVDDQLANLKEAARNRAAKLRDSLDSQQYYAEASEAELWMKDRYICQTAQQNFISQ